MSYEGYGSQHSDEDEDAGLFHFTWPMEKALFTKAILWSYVLKVFKKIWKL